MIGVVYYLSQFSSSQHENVMQFPKYQLLWNKFNSKWLNAYRKNTVLVMPGKSIRSSLYYFDVISEILLWIKLENL